MSELNELGKNEVIVVREVSNDLRYFCHCKRPAKWFFAIAEVLER